MKLNLIMLLGLAGCLTLPSFLQAEEIVAPLPVRVIAADFTDIKGPRSEVWRECIGAGRANEGLRADWQRQLKLCQDEIGFRAIRFHGLLHDDMGVYSEGANGQPIHNWQYIDELYDDLLAMHIRPFVELSFMPSALASGSKRIFWWNANVTPPKSYTKWDGLIEDLVRHWTERYGVDEVKKWNFEVWNEPNYSGFWGPRNPNRPKEEYFELYAHTVAAIKRVNPAYQVGGPSGAGPGWVSDFLANCTTNALPLDFVSYHAYGLGDGPSGLDEHGDRLLYLSENLHSPADIANSQRPIIDSSGLPHLPIHITEWSTSYSPRDPIHDAYFSAPYILEQLKHTEVGVASMSYWTFTDIFEENGPAKTPFHGGFGLLNLEGIKKPAYFAYRFLAMLGPLELQNTDAKSWVCRDERDNVQCLFWNLERPMTTDASDQVTFRQVQPSGVAGVVQLRLTHLTPGTYRLQYFRIGFEKNDAYTAYLKMGAPAQLTRQQLQTLRDQSSGRPESEKECTIDAAGTFSDSFSMRTNDVWLLTLNKKF